MLEKMLLIIICMTMMHIIDDYYLQGCLADLKQKSWWEKNNPGKMYGKDYIIALILHGFSWAFCITLPCVITFGFELWQLFLFAMNVALHALIDNMKANEKEINLTEDQTLHLIQILATAATYYGMYCA